MLVCFHLVDIGLSEFYCFLKLYEGIHLAAILLISFLLIIHALYPKSTASEETA